MTLVRQEDLVVERWLIRCEWLVVVFIIKRLKHSSQVSWRWLCRHPVSLAFGQVSSTELWVPKHENETVKTVAKQFGILRNSAAEATKYHGITVNEVTTKGVSLS